MYIAFWLALSLLLSVVCRRAATAALAAIAIWLVLTLFAGLIAGIIADSMHDVPSDATTEQVLANARIELNIRRISPDQLYKEATGRAAQPVAPVDRHRGHRREQAARCPRSLPLARACSWRGGRLVSLVKLGRIVMFAAYVAFLRQEVRVAAR